MTLYAFSIENFNRNRAEVDALMRIFKENLEELADRKTLDYKINFIGRTQLFDAELQESMKRLREKTSANKYRANFAMAYDGRAEIVDAVKEIATAVKDRTILPDCIDEKTIEECLYLQSNPDLIIRTSGEQRISGFLLWQASYAELYFCEKNWPDFSKKDLENAVKEYSARQRRFGK